MLVPVAAAKSHHHRQSVTQLKVHVRASATDHGSVVSAAVAYLQLDRATIVADLKAGQSLAQIATAHGKTADGLVTALLAPAKLRLDAAVAAGRLTSDKEARSLRSSRPSSRRSSITRRRRRSRRFASRTAVDPQAGADVPPARPPRRRRSAAQREDARADRRRAGQDRCRPRRRGRRVGEGAARRPRHRRQAHRRAGDVLPRDAADERREARQRLDPIVATRRGIARLSPAARRAATAPASRSDARARA